METPLRLEEGANVEANYCGLGSWSSATITRDRGDDTYDISYDDGCKSETRVGKDLIRLEDSADAKAQKNDASGRNRAAQAQAQAQAQAKTQAQATAQSECCSSF